MTGNVGEISGQATISSTQSMTALDFDHIRKFLTQLGDGNGLPEPQKAQIQELVSHLNQELNRERPIESRIRNFLGSMRAAAETVAGNLIAAGIVQLIASLPHL
jgi:hypothetical protein